MKAISERIPSDIIESIGAAPKIGRNRWLDLADLIEKSQHLKTARQVIQSKAFTDLTSSEQLPDVELAERNLTITVLE